MAQPPITPNDIEGWLKDLVYDPEKAPPPPPGQPSDYIPPDIRRPEGWSGTLSHLVEPDVGKTFVASGKPPTLSREVVEKYGKLLPTWESIRDRPSLRRSALDYIREHPDPPSAEWIEQHPGVEPPEWGPVESVGAISRVRLPGATAPEDPFKIISPAGEPPPRFETEYSNAPSMFRKLTPEEHAENSWFYNLPHDENYALRDWIKGGSGNIKRVQRARNADPNWKPTDPYIEKYYLKTTDNFEKGIKKAPDYEGSVYRGLDRLYQAQVDQYKNLLGVFENDVHSSASTGMEVPRYFAGHYDWASPDRQQLVIEFKNSKAHALNPKNLLPDVGFAQNEVILPKGSRYNVDEFKEHYYGPNRHHVILSRLPEDFDIGNRPLFKLIEPGELLGVGDALTLPAWAATELHQATGLLGTTAVEPGSALYSTGISGRPAVQPGTAQEFQEGGQVQGQGNTDSVAAALTPGEFVLPKHIVQTEGIEDVKALAKGKAKIVPKESFKDSPLYKGKTDKAIPAFVPTPAGQQDKTIKDYAEYLNALEQQSPHGIAIPDPVTNMMIQNVLRQQLENRLESPEIEGIVGASGSGAISGVKHPDKYKITQKGPLIVPGTEDDPVPEGQLSSLDATILPPWLGQHQDTGPRSDIPRSTGGWSWHPPPGTVLSFQEGGLVPEGTDAFSTQGDTSSFKTEQTTQTSKSPATVEPTGGATGQGAGIYTPSKPDFMNYNPMSNTGLNDMMKFFKDIYANIHEPGRTPEPKHITDLGPTEDAAPATEATNLDGTLAVSNPANAPTAGEHTDGFNKMSGWATTFGLEPDTVVNDDGTVDTKYFDKMGDNGWGAFGYNTRDPKLVGGSMPVDVITSTIGDYLHDPAIWSQIRNGDYRMSVTNKATGQNELMKFVDSGPANWTGNLLDLTFGAQKKLGLTGKDQVDVQIVGPGGETIPIKGFHPDTVTRGIGEFRHAIGPRKEREAEEEEKPEETKPEETKPEDKEAEKTDLPSVVKRYDDLVKLGQKNISSLFTEPELRQLLDVLHQRGLAVPKSQEKIQSALLTAPTVNQGFEAGQR